MLEATGSVLGMGFNGRKCDFRLLWSWVLEFSIYHWGVLHISKQCSGESFNARVLSADFTHDIVHVLAPAAAPRPSFRYRLQGTAILFWGNNHLLGISHADKNIAPSFNIQKESSSWQGRFLQHSHAVVNIGSS